MPRKKNLAVFPGLMRRAKQPSTPASESARQSTSPSCHEPAANSQRDSSAIEVEASTEQPASQQEEESSSSISGDKTWENGNDFEAEHRSPKKPSTKPFTKPRRKVSTGRPRGRPPKLPTAAAGVKGAKKQKKEKKEKTVPTERAWHKAFVKDLGASARPPPKRPVGKVEEVRHKVLKEVLNNEQTAPEPVETIEEILARDAPADEPEYISLATEKRNPEMFAPLIGGTTPEERAKIEQEILAMKAVTMPDRYHSEYLKTRSDDPGNFNKLLFYDGVPPKRKLAIAGVAKDPLLIDPPGSGTPFDALNFPDRLVNQLNRDDAETLYGWDAKALKKIPNELMMRIEPAILSKMPDEVLSRQPLEILDKLPSHAPFFRNLPFNSKLKRAEHRASYIKRQSTTRVDAEAPAPVRDLRSASIDGLRGEGGKFLTAPARGAGGKFLPKTTTAQTDPVSARSQKNRKGRAVEREKTPNAKGPIAPLSRDRCSNCVTVGVKCNGQKPECFWCRKNGYRCSFLVENASTNRLWSSKAPGSRLDFDSLTVEEGTNAYLPSFLQEESFSSRPSIRITIPDHLKGLLVDDWENVTKSLLLVPLPSQAPANFIIDTYYNEEKMNRRLGSAEADVLEEFCAGMKVYFEKSVGKILLYRFERSQLADVCGTVLLHQFLSVWH